MSTMIQSEYSIQISASNTQKTKAANVPRPVWDPKKVYNYLEDIHKENPNVDIYVRSQGTPENHNFQMRNSRISLVISTDEIKLLQSKKESDKDAQDALWNTILEKIRA